MMTLIIHDQITFLIFPLFKYQCDLWFFEIISFSQNRKIFIKIYSTILSILQISTLLDFSIQFFYIYFNRHDVFVQVKKSTSTHSNWSKRKNSIERHEHSAWTFLNFIWEIMFINIRTFVWSTISNFFLFSFYQFDLNFENASQIDEQFFIERKNKVIQFHK